MHAPVRSSASFAPADTALLLGLASMWGLSFLFVELALRGLGPVWIVAGRTGVGALVLLAIVLVRRQQLPRRARLWGHLAVLGISANAVPWTAVAMAQREIPSGLAALLMALVPSSTFLVAAIVRMEKVTAARIAGLGVALAGVAIIVAPGLDDRGRVLAVLSVAAATLLYAGAAVYAKRYVSGVMPPLVIATGQVTTAFLAALTMALLLDDLPTGAAVRWDVLGPVAALGALGTGVAYLVFYTLIARVGATNSVLVTYLVPLVAVIAGAVFLGERFGASELAGGAAIGVGIWLAQRPADEPVDQREDVTT